MIAWGGNGADAGTYTVGPEAIGLTSRQYDGLRLMEEGNHPDVARPDLEALLAAGFVVQRPETWDELDEERELVTQTGTAYVVTERGREALKVVGTFRRVVAPRLEPVAWGPVELAVFATLVAVVVAVVMAAL